MTDVSRKEAGLAMTGVSRKEGGHPMTRSPVWTALALCAALAACGTTPKESFYTLSEGASEDMSSLHTQDYGGGVGPVSVPDLVDRPQFGLRVRSGEVRIAEQARWAEPLRDAIARAVAANLAQALDNSRVAPQTSRDPGDRDYQVLLDVQRFDSALARAATLEVVWTVRRVRANGAPQTGRVRLQEPVAGESYQALVAAHSRAIAVLSGKIAESIRASQQNDVAAAPTAAKQ